MKVKKISAANVEACSLPRLFDEEKIDFQPVQCVNWAEYPYKPKVNFRIAHTKNSILLHFKVKEASVRARLSLIHISMTSLFGICIRKDRARQAVIRLLPVYSTGGVSALKVGSSFRPLLSVFMANR